MFKNMMKRSAHLWLKSSDSICKKKSDVSVMTREMKIPVNSKSLVAPPVKAEIWQFLERKAKTSDLNFRRYKNL